MINPLAKKKARAINQGIGSPKAENAAANVSVLVRTHAPSPINATAPSGRGCVMIPTIVARNIESNCHAFLETPVGTGTNQRITPVAIEASRGFIAAPCHGTGAGAGSCLAGTTAADACTEKFWFLFGDLRLSSGKRGVRFDVYEEDDRRWS